MFYFPDSKNGIDVEGSPININLCITFEKDYIDGGNSIIRFYTNNDAYIWKFYTEMDRDLVFKKLEQMFILNI